MIWLARAHPAARFEFSGVPKFLRPQSGPPETEGYSKNGFWFGAGSRGKTEKLRSRSVTARSGRERAVRDGAGPGAEEEQWRGRTPRAIIYCVALGRRLRASRSGGSWPNRVHMAQSWGERGGLGVSEFPAVPAKKFRHRSFTDTPPPVARGRHLGVHGLNIGQPPTLSVLPERQK